MPSCFSVGSGMAHLIIINIMAPAISMQHPIPMYICVIKVCFVWCCIVKQKNGARREAYHRNQPCFFVAFLFNGVHVTMTSLSFRGT